MFQWWPKFNFCFRFLSLVSVWFFVQNIGNSIAKIYEQIVRTEQHSIALLFYDHNCNGAGLIGIRWAGVGDRIDQLGRCINLVIAVVVGSFIINLSPKLTSNSQSLQIILNFPGVGRFGQQFSWIINRILYPLCYWFLSLIMHCIAHV